MIFGRQWLSWSSCLLWSTWLQGHLNLQLYHSRNGYHECLCISIHPNPPLLFTKLQGEKFIAFIAFHYDPNKYSMYTFTFLITSTTFAVTELGHHWNVIGFFFRSITLKWKGNDKTSKCPFIKRMQFSNIPSSLHCVQQLHLLFELCNFHFQRLPKPRLLLQRI